MAGRDGGEYLPICNTHLTYLTSGAESFVGNGTAPGNDTYTVSNDSSEDSGSEQSGSFWERLLSEGQLIPIQNPGWFQIILPLLCAIGICGNVLNLIILGRKQLSGAVGTLEKSATGGLLALAVSDMMFCVVVVPYSFLPPASQLPIGAATVFPSNTSHVFFLYYSVYGVSAINLFIMISTWLIVTLAVERYIALYYPLHAKRIITVRRTQIVTTVVYAASTLLTLPYFVNFRVHTCEGLDGQVRLERLPRFDAGSLGMRANMVYIRHVWPVVAVFLPLTSLLFCNIRLIQGLRQASNARKLNCPGQAVKHVNRRITLTLIIIIALALLLVTPGEVLRILNPYRLLGDSGHVVVAAFNLLQTVSFAVNFVLYLAVDKHFRVICQLMLGNCSADSAAAARRQHQDLLVAYKRDTGTSLVACSAV